MTIQQIEQGANVWVRVWANELCVRMDVRDWSISRAWTQDLCINQYIGIAQSGIAPSFILSFFPFSSTAQFSFVRSFVLLDLHDSYTYVHDSIIHAFSWLADSANTS